MKKVLLVFAALSFLAGISQAFERPRRDDPPHKMCPAGYVMGPQGNCVPLSALPR